MYPSISRNTELGTHAICSTDKHRILVSCSLKVEYTAKATDLHVSTWSTGGTYERLDDFNKSIPGINRDTCFSVSQLVPRMIGCK
jgi:hypothetical protein